MFSNNGIVSARQKRHMASVQFFAVGGLFLMAAYSRIGWQLFALLLAASVGYGILAPASPQWERTFRLPKMILLCMLPAVLALGIYTFLIGKQFLPERGSGWILTPLALLCLLAGRKPAEARGRLFEMLYLYIWLLFLCETVVFLAGWDDALPVCNTLFQLAMVCGIFGYVSQSLHRYMQLGGQLDEA